MNPYQEKILKIYNENNGNLPPFRQLAKLIGVSSLNTVSYHVNQLKKKGYFNLEHSENGLVEFSVKNILNLGNKSGVYVLLNNKKPFYVSESENIKNDLLEILSQNDSKIISNLKNISAATVAFYLISEKPDRENLKSHLIDYYSKQGFELL